MTCAMCHGDHIRAKGLGADFVTHIGHYVEYLQGLLRGFTQAVAINRGAGFTDKFAQQRNTRIFIQAGVLGTRIQFQAQFGNSFAVTG